MASAPSLPSSSELVVILINWDQLWVSGVLCFPQSTPPTLGCGSLTGPSLGHRWAPDTPLSSWPLSCWGAGSG